MDTSRAGCLAGCECYPDGYERCEYRILADHIIELLNPRDGEEGELDILLEAVANLASYVQALPCVCTPDVGVTEDPCGRCWVLGRIGDQLMIR